MRRKRLSRLSIIVNGLLIISFLVNPLAISAKTRAPRQASTVEPKPVRSSNSVSNPLIDSLDEVAGTLSYSDPVEVLPQASGNRVIIGTNDKGVFVTSDITASPPVWTALNSGLTGDALKINEVALNPFNPANVAYIATELGVYKNTAWQGSGSWTEILSRATAESMFGIEAGTGRFADVKLSPVQNSLVYVVVTGFKAGDNRSFITRSEDGGTSWVAGAEIKGFGINPQTLISRKAFHGGTKGSIWVSSHDPNKLWASAQPQAGSGNYLSVSTDKGNSFSAVRQAGNSNAPTQIYVPHRDNPDDQVMYLFGFVAPDSRIEKSTDGGVTWTDITPPGRVASLSAARRSFDAHTGGAGLLFAATSPSGSPQEKPRVSSSSDDGQIWNTGPFLAPHNYVLMDLSAFPNDSQRLLAALGDAGAGSGVRPDVMLSQDRGATWIDKTGNLWTLWGDSASILIRRVTAIQHDQIFHTPDELHQLGKQKWNPFIAEPVNTATGNYVYQREDLSISSRGLPLSFIRAYNSRDSYQGPLGFIWTHTYNLNLVEETDGAVVFQNWDGRRDRYTPDGAGGYTPPPGVFATLVKNPDGSFRLTSPDQTRFNFSSQGKLQSIIDSNGNTVSFTYDGAGNLVTITDPVGRALQLAYDANNRVNSITDPLNRTLRYGYDAAGDLSSFTDAAGGAWAYTYDANHRLLTVADPNGHVVVTNEYDAQGRVSAQLDAASNRTTFSYDTTNRITTITDPRGNITKHYYDASFRFIRQDDALGNSTFFEYDQFNNRTSATDARGNRTTFTYDSRGNLLSQTDPLGKLTSYTYDARNNLASVTDPLGRVTTYAYDANNNLTSITRSLGGNPVVTSFTYDALGQLTSITDPNNHTTTFAYDAQGNLTSITDALGAVTSYAYDGVGRRTSMTDARSKLWSYTYDALDRLTRVTDPLTNATSFAYDGVGNLSSMTDANGNTTSYAYDARDNLTQVSQSPAAGVSYVTRYAYDANNNLINVTDADNHTTTYAYDVLNRLTSAADPLGNRTTYAYDANGNLISRTDAKAKTTTYAYDVLNRLTNITYADPSSPAVTYTYDALGNRLSMADGSGTTNYAYDDLYRLVQVTEPGALIFSYGYDAVGNRTRVTSPSSRVVSYAYDAADRLIRTTDGANVTTTAYDAVGNLIQESLPNGIVSTFTYDDAIRLTKVEHKLGATVISSYTYTLDRVGNRLSMADASGGLTSYTYDKLYRLTRVDYPSAGALSSGTVSTQAPDTDPINDPDAGAGGGGGDVQPDPQDTFTTYTYDPVGNRLTHQNFQGTFTYTYDIADRLISLRKPDGTTQPFTYDANGNLLGDGINTFAYDLADRLIKFTPSGGGAKPTDLTYNGDGLRVRKAVGNKSLTYHWDVARALPVVMWETDARGRTQMEYTYGVDLLSEINFQGRGYYYLQDGLGSVTQLTNASGEMVTDYVYDAFGDIRARTTGKGRIPRNVFDFTAQQRDMQSDMLYLRARYYEGTVGRFITRDPYPFQPRHPQTLHRFIYALNNPINFADPRGEQVALGLTLIEITLIGIGLGAIYLSTPQGREQVEQAFEIILEAIAENIRESRGRRDPILEQHEKMVANLLRNPRMEELFPGSVPPGPKSKLWRIIIAALTAGYTLRQIAEYCGEVARMYGQEVQGFCQAIQAEVPLPKK